MDTVEIVMVVKEVLKQLRADSSTNIAPEFYSIKDAAIVTSLSERHIRRAIIGGTLVASDLGTHDHPHYRISRQNLLSWIKEREAGPKPPARQSKTDTARTPVPSRHHKPRTRKPPE